MKLKFSKVWKKLMHSIFTENQFRLFMSILYQKDFLEATIHMSR